MGAPLGTGTSVDRSEDSIQAFVRHVYLPAGITQLFNEASQLRDSLVLVETSMDKLNQIWEIYNKKGGQVSGDDSAIVIDVDVEALDTGDEDDFIPNYILETEATSADVDRLDSLKDDLEDIIDELTDADPANALAEQLQAVVDALDDIDDVDDLEYWQNDFKPQSGSLDPDIYLDSDAEAVAYGNQIRDALSASQASNERARQDLRQALFTWEEFVKSAGSVIERLTRMVESFARGVKGQ